MSDSNKPSHWKGQSRVQKACHWCGKKQEDKAFQACSRCKEVIYCSKECQVASWPHHKAGCKLSSQNKEVLGAQSPAMAKAIANFKKWHASHVPALRSAAICALDLGHNPSNLDDGVLYIEVKLKVDHEKLPPHKKYEPVGGCTFTMEETRQMLGRRGAADVLKSAQEASNFMKQKGGLGVAIILMQAHDAVDIVKVTLPSPAAAKLSQETDNWGEDWVERFRMAVD
ncbi:hypothetical protein Hypma_002611 [Hypsizygus marmoreus]|uniref:MYND-type domain-containing protein n=1 Tax=Hypsizygus marmoreus TaxID=39966 RepID=A0A369J6D1_HYPMA|nr:hypothetical protein Hypma_002611 [Hypsizygus marmoreus]